ncbi:MAG: serine/threonine protein kinase [Eubacterium sp.]|nr:serine/threonine protein kinase [Eubacterium sp.]
MKNIINNVVGGRYYVLEHIASGGCSDVYKVRDVYSGMFYALKKYITSDPANQKNLMEGMEKELNALRHCSHPVLPKIYNLIKEEENFYLIMEYVEGTNLKEYVARNGIIKTKMLQDIMMQVCSGIYYLHSLDPPVVYRDLKPSNIILKNDGHVKLIDFGIAKRYRIDVADEQAFGSAGFAAPEQFGDARGVSLFNTDIRTDIYGIGTTMYYLKTKKKYTGRISSEKIHGKLKRIIKKCTQVNPDKRYQNCIEVLCEMKSLHIF